MYKYIVSLVLFIFLSHNVSADAPPEEAPSVKEVLQTLFQSNSLIIKTLPHCESAFSDPDDNRLGPYLAGHLANFTEQGDNQIINNCIFTQSGHWDCLLTFRHNIPDQEVFFNYGLTFSLDSEKKLIEDSIDCWGGA